MKKMSSKKNRFLAATALGFFSAAALSPQAHASGFGLREGSADWLGNAFVGGSAKAYDAGTAYSNPAGMALLDQSQFSGNVSFIAPSAKFNGTGSYVGAGRTGNVVSPAASGALFGVFVLNPDWRLGMSVTNPYGERTSYDKNWVGRYNSLVSSITGIDFSVALSYKVNNHLSVGGGPVVEYFHARLTQAIPANPYTQAPSALADVHGSDVALGYNLGVLYQFDADTRVGLDYRSRIRHNIHGSEVISGDLGKLENPITGEISSDARTAATVPDSINASIYQQVTPALALMGTVEWTHWDLFNALHVTPAEAGFSPVTINENWRNTWFAGVGANYQATDRLMLQTGFSFDESPVTNANRTSRVPDSNHYNLGFGVKYKLFPSTTLNVAYLHVFTPGGTINNTDGLTGSTLTGDYSASDNSVTAGITYIF